MMVRVAPGVPHLVDPATRRVVCCIAPSYWVVASATRARERSAVRHCTLAVGHDNVVYPHVLQSPDNAWAHLGTWDTCQCWSLPEQGGGVRSHGMCGSIGAPPSWEVGSGAAGHVAAPKPSLAGRRVLELGTHGCAWTHACPLS
jgi:hypothetical protein